MPASRPDSRTQRRVARTKAAIEDAFVQLVLERGYDRVAVEDITDRADLARATFYAHYPNKEAVQFSVFNRLTEDLVQRIADQGGAWNVIHRDAISAAYQQAAEMPDLYSHLPQQITIGSAASLLAALIPYERSGNPPGAPGTEG